MSTIDITAINPSTNTNAITDLCVEAGAHGDSGMVALCNLALSGDAAALSKVAAFLGQSERADATLVDCESGEPLRNATMKELTASVEAARTDGGAGVIRVDGRRCYVEE